ncbi:MULTISPECIES: hypothetical protein [Cellulophaga]|uniref:hypothetical protein n=1 Tax=Cellulophaga TaxID=104264 RepID=UPI001269E306|nr:MULTISPECIES: hypothetical protein [Cellulophaga]
MYKSITVLFLSLFLVQCESSSETTTTDCSVVSCLSNNFKMIIIDEASGANLIANGTYTASNITIFDEASMNAAFSVTTTEETPGIYLSLDILESQEKSYTVNLKTDAFFTMNMDIEKTGEGSECCGIDTEIDSISVSGATSEIDLENKTITLFII